MARLEARLPRDIHSLLKRAAELQGRTLTDFVIAAASAAAVTVIQESALVHLSVQDQLQLAEALLNPPKPNPALRRAFKDHAKLAISR